MPNLDTMNRLTSICPLIGLFAVACSPCTDIPLQYRSSPDNQFAAEVIERHCGKPSDFAQRLTLRHDSWRRWFSRRIEVFVLDGPQSITEKWSADSRVLEVWYSGGVILYQDAQWEGIEIRYHPPEQGGGASGASSASVSPPVVPTSQDAGIWRGGTGRRAIGHGPHRQEH